MPAEAKGTSEASAKAFVRYYFATINFAARTGDTDQLRELGSPDCTSCEAITENIADIYGDGGNIRSDGWELRSIIAVPLQPRNKPIFDLSVFLNPEQVTSGETGEPEDFEGGKQPMTVYLVRQDSAWHVVQLDKVS